MAKKSAMRFTITLKDVSKIDTDAESLTETGFLGLGHVYRLADPNVLYFRAREDVAYEDVIETLEELRLMGVLVYFEDGQDSKP